MKKIVFFTGAMGRGGAERVISLLSGYYLHQGWQVRIATALHSQVEYELEAGVIVTDLSAPAGIKKKFAAVLKNIRNYVAEEKPDVVVAFMAQVCLLVGIALRKAKIPMVMSERIDPSQVHRNFIYKIVLNQIYENASAVIFQTRRARNFFDEKIQKNSYMIANPIKVYAEASATPQKRIVTAGRLTAQKNQKMLIDAFCEVHKKHPEYRLDIYGEGELREDLSSQIEALGLEKCASLKGNVSDLHKQIANAEIFVLPSDFEGLSNALLEAMMMGFPVISTNCAGSDEVIESGKNGILIPVGDRGALIENLEKLIGDANLRSMLSENAKASAAAFKVENIIEQWNAVIEQSIADLCRNDY